jgi:hypothetical protein
METKKKKKSHISVAQNLLNISTYVKISAFWVVVAIV